MIQNSFVRLCLAQGTVKAMETVVDDSGSLKRSVGELQSGCGPYMPSAMAALEGRQSMRELSHVNRSLGTLTVWWIYYKKSMVQEGGLLKEG